MQGEWHLGAGGLVPGFGHFVPGFGGLVPDLGGLVPGLGGFVPGLEGPVQGFGLATFGGVLPRSSATAVRVAATDGVPPRQPMVEKAVVSARPPPPTGAQRQRTHRAKKARKEGGSDSSTSCKPDGAKLLGIGSEQLCSITLSRLA